MRGKPISLPFSSRYIRITPAGAGKTNARRLSRKTCQDHPRRCGENCRGYSVKTQTQGSPPQVRGKPQQGCRTRRCGGITPAGAGKTPLARNKRPPVWDHPRRCGENRQDDELREKEIGSPPQVRGKRPTAGYTVLDGRITPAGAGKTLFRPARQRSLRDHPRRCGENCSPLRVSATGAGSPPQVRGKLYSLQLIPLIFRITPAGAGKTLGIGGSVFPRQDHPRRCGENACTFTVELNNKGSPPQVRGKPITEAFKADIDRITPAGAGKTWRLRQTLPTAQDHPRRCGENRGGGQKIGILSGSPPQVRGKLITLRPYQQECRITPAGAGKTLCGA